MLDTLSSSADVFSSLLHRHFILFRVLVGSWCPARSRANELWLETTLVRLPSTIQTIPCCENLNAARASIGVSVQRNTSRTSQRRTPSGHGIRNSHDRHLTWFTELQQAGPTKLMWVKCSQILSKASPDSEMDGDKLLKDLLQDAKMHPLDWWKNPNSKAISHPHTSFRYLFLTLVISRWICRTFITAEAL